MTLKVGLTGGIGSGKTLASNRFAELGAEVIDTDQLSRELVEPGQTALAEIVAEFGEEILQADGRLDRATLRRLIFDRPDARERLERILHPRIRDAMLARAAQSAAPYTLFVIPLLLETGQQELVDRVLVIDTPETLQRRRAARRDAVDPTEIDRILAAQIDRDSRLRHADDVLINDRGIPDLINQVDELHQRYLKLAAVTRPDEQSPEP